MGLWRRECAERNARVRPRSRHSLRPGWRGREGLRSNVTVATSRKATYVVHRERQPQEACADNRGLKERARCMCANETNAAVAELTRRRIEGCVGEVWAGLGHMRGD